MKLEIGYEFVPTVSRRGTIHGHGRWEGNLQALGQASRVFFACEHAFKIMQMTSELS
jgi:hypothetical protein